ncbi:MAG: response regulator [Planctomycetes bacterium]|nr:response regulator [Planctomycetota bacterium]
MHRLIALFADAADAVVVAAPEGTIVHVNEAARHLFGLRAGETAGIPLASLCPFGVDLEGGPPDGRLVRCFARDGRAIEARVVVLNIDADDRRLAVCVFWPLGGAEDATHPSSEYQRALLQLARTKELSSGDFSAAARVTCLIAADTLQVERISIWMLVEDGKFLECQCLLERSTQKFSSGTRLAAKDYPAYFAALEEGRAIAAHDAAHDPRTSEFATGYLDALGIGALLDSVLRVEGKVIGVVCHEHVGPPRTWREAEVVFAGEVADQAAQAWLTAERLKSENERDRLAAELRQAQKLEALGRLAAGVAHDFNNLLSVILGNAELGREAEDAAEIQDAFDEIHTAGERAAELTSQLLAIGRRQVLSPVDLDWNQRLESSIKLLRRLIPEHISLQFHPTDARTLVRADPAQIDQIVMNLCLNARDAVSEGGRITISTLTERGSHGEPDQVVLRVRDDGPGIPDEYRDRIFDPFFTSKEKGAGTGLGLSMIYGIVRQHGGSVRVDSSAERGSCFEVRLPASKSEAAAPKSSQQTTPESPQEGTILLAEDSGPLRRMTRRLLERAGYEVLEAPDGLAAMERFRQHRSEVDLALLDVVMPEQDGRATFEALRAIDPHLPVLFMTGYGAEVLSSEFLARTDVHIIAKPFEARDLVRAVHEALESNVPTSD